MKRHLRLITKMTLEHALLVFGTVLPLLNLDNNQYPCGEFKFSIKYGSSTPAITHCLRPNAGCHVLDQNKEEMIYRAVERNIEKKRQQELLHCDWDALKHKWIDQLRYLDRLSGGYSSQGNQVLLLLGEAILPALLQSIEGAKERIWIETYMFDDSPVAERVLLALLKAKMRGIDVILIIDWLGSFDMPLKWIRMLKQANIPVIVVHDWSNIGFRDHRKLAIIDQAGFCGSANISAEAAPKHIGGNNRFFDIHLKIEGPAVCHLSELFCQTLNQYSFDVRRFSPTTFNIEGYNADSGCFVQVLESNAKRKRRSIQTAYNRMIGNASLSVAATVGYFAPPTLLYWNLKRVINKSIPLTLILSGNSDVLGDVYAATYCVSKLQKTAQRVLMSKTGIASSLPKSPLRVSFTVSHQCHAKTLVVDGVWSAVGSFNFDRHSGRRNMEAVVAVMDVDLANQLQSVYDAIQMNTTSKNPFPLLNSIQSEQSISSSVKSLLPKVPTSLDMALHDWHKFSSKQRFFMRIAYWFLYVSASPIFDSFDDVDGDAKRLKKQQKWKASHHKAQHFFHFGPSDDSLNTHQSCY